MKSKTKIIFFIGIFFWASLAGIFGIYDLSISQALYNPNSLWAHVFETGGRLITPMILALGIQYLLSLYIPIQKKLVYFLHFLIVVAVLAMILLFSGGLQSLWQEVFFILLYFGLYCGMRTCTHTLSTTQKDQLKKIVWLTIVSCALVLIFNTILKIMVGRLRFRDMTQLSQFVPWYQWHPFSGNHSFPSGHTANSSGIFICFLLASMVHSKWKKRALCLFPIIYCLAMSISRIVMGAHYASDVLFAIGISSVVWWIVISVAYRKNILQHASFIDKELENPW